MHTSYYSFPSPVSGRSPTLPQFRVPKYGYYGIAGELTSLQGNLSLEPDISLNHLHDVRPKSSRADSSIMVATVQTCAFFSGVSYLRNNMSSTYVQIFDSCVVNQYDFINQTFVYVALADRSHCNSIRFASHWLARFTASLRLRASYGVHELPYGQIAHQAGLRKLFGYC